MREGTSLKLRSSAPQWRDILPFMLPFFTYFLYHIGVEKFNNPTLIIWIAYVVIPLLDFLIPHDKINLSQEATETFEKDKRFLIPLYGYILIDFASFIYSLYLASTGFVF